MSSYVIRKTPGDTDWYIHDRFGMFIHFGISSMASRSSGVMEHGCEWIKSDQCMSEEQYDRYFKNFNPDMYQPDKWAKMAKDAGMKYVVMTAKHHDGFCLFDSKYTDYKVTNTPYGKDIIKEYGKIDIVWYDFSYMGPPTELKIHHFPSAKARTIGRPRSLLHLRASFSPAS